MPYADPERKRERMRQWRKESIADGYGKWLYARRKLRFDDAERFRLALEEIASLTPEGSTSVAVDIARDAILASQEAYLELGPWKGRDDEQTDS